MRHFHLAFLPLTLAAVLAAPVASADTKIGVLNMQQIRAEAPQLKAAEQKFKIEFDKRSQDLDADKKKFQDDLQKANRDADSMSAQQKAQTEKEFMKRKQDLDTRDRNLNEEASNRNQEVQRAFFGQLNQAVADVVKDKQLDLVLTDAAFAATQLDITQDVLKKLAAMPDTGAADDASKKKKKK